MNRILGTFAAAFAPGILLAVACGGSSSTAANADGGIAADAARPALADAFAAAGFSILEGRYGAIDLAGCCADGASCFANNPASPYLAVTLPPGPGQTATNPKLFQDSAGRSAAFRLRRDEAVVLFGPPPPAAAYVGLTPYVYDRAPASGTERAVVFASVSDSFSLKDLSQLSLPAGASIAFVFAADATTEARAVAALTSTGVPEKTIVRMPWVVTGGTPTNPIAFGFENISDTFGILGRVALPKDPAALRAYLAAPQVAVYRLTPTAGVADASPAPFPQRTPAIRDDERELVSALDELEQALRTHYADGIITPVAVTDASPDPIACLSELTNCNGDNRDTDYPSSLPFLFPAGDDRIIILGVNHAATGHSTYSSFGVYTIDHLLGVSSVANDAYANSANSWIPKQADAPKLFAWSFARSCAGETSCTAISADACPSGIADNAAAFLTFRDYVDPVTGTRPRYQDLVPSRVLRYRKRR